MTFVIYFENMLSKQTFLELLYNMFMYLFIKYSFKKLGALLKK